VSERHIVIDQQRRDAIRIRGALAAWILQTIAHGLADV
jgi:hypothetical protein